MTKNKFIAQAESELQKILGTLVPLDEMAQGPTLDRPPAGMAKGNAAKKAWKHVMDKYSKAIFKNNDSKKQWAAAVAILKRHAKKAGVVVFETKTDIGWDKFIGERLSASEIVIVETAYEKDLDPDKTIIVTGVMGMKSKPFKKKFKNFAAVEKWVDSDDSDDYDIQNIVNEEVKPVEDGKPVDEDKNWDKAKKALNKQKFVSDANTNEYDYKIGMGGQLAAVNKDVADDMAKALKKAGVKHTVKGSVVVIESEVEESDLEEAYLIQHKKNKKFVALGSTLEYTSHKSDARKFKNESEASKFIKKNMSEPQLSLLKPVKEDVAESGNMDEASNQKKTTNHITSARIRLLQMKKDETDEAKIKNLDDLLGELDSVLLQVKGLDEDTLDEVLSLPTGIKSYKLSGNSIEFDFKSENQAKDAEEWVSRSRLYGGRKTKRNGSTLSIDIQTVVGYYANNVLS